MIIASLILPRVLPREFHILAEKEVVRRPGPGRAPSDM